MTMAISLAVICLSQLAYVDSCNRCGATKGTEDTVKGIIIAASLTALLNVACTGISLTALPGLDRSAIATQKVARVSGMSEPNLDGTTSGAAKESQGSFGLGLGLTINFHLIIQVPIFFILPAATSDRGLGWPIPGIMYMGLTQLVYMIPAILLSRGRGETETAKGLIIGASVTFLLTSACSGLMYLNR